MPPVQPVTPVPPMSGMPPVGGGMGMNPAGMGSNMMPMVQQVQVQPEPKKDVAGLVKTIVIVILSLALVTFIGLFIWMTVEKTTLEEEWDTRTAAEVAKAVDEEAMDQANKCAEDKKYPYETFTGPVDYGQLSLQYPKTWSVYVERAATQGGDFYAYMNPVQVDEVGDDTINALRITISTDTFDEVTADYQDDVEDEDSQLTMSSIQIGDAEKGTTSPANRYDGVIPGTELRGSIVVFKIRDKTVILQTDSELFIPEFDKLLGTITFNA